MWFICPDSEALAQGLSDGDDGDYLCVGRELFEEKEIDVKNPEPGA